MIEIGPNLVAVLLALVAVLSILVQSYFNAKHAELVQRQTNSIAAEQMTAAAAAVAKAKEVPPSV